MSPSSNFINYLMSKAFFIINMISLTAIVGCNNNKQRVSTPQQQQADTSVAPLSAIKVKTILFFGNSLTAGYGVDPSEAFPALIQNKIDSLKLPYKVINGGVSGETSAAGNSRVTWILQQQVDIFVLELGGNDGLRGIPLAETKKNLQGIIDKVKAKYPEAKVILAGMQIPPNMGQKYTTEFTSLYPDLAAKNRIALIPFLLQGVGGEATLNQRDGIHPTAEGHNMIAENVWDVLKDDL